MSNFGPIYQSTMACAKAQGMSEADCTALAPVARRYQQGLDYIEGLVKAKRLHDADHHARKLLGSPEAKVTALVRTAKRRPDGVAPTLAKIQARAAKLCLFKPIKEPVVVRPTSKPEGGTRMISIFGWSRQAAQQLCCDILSLYYRPAPFDFLVSGKRGHHGAVERLAQLIEQEKSSYVVVVDIRNLYGSADKEKVATHLPLPKPVTRNALLVQDDVKVVVKPSLQDELAPLKDSSALIPDEAIRQGLSQGSRASGLIMYQGVLGPLLGVLSFSDKLVLYGDDLAVPVKDEAEAQATLHALEAAFAASPVGLLNIGRHSVAYIYDGVDFLGYRIKRKIWKRPLHFCPSPKSFRRFHLRAKLKYILGGRGYSGFAATISYRWAWLRSWRFWEANSLSKLYQELYLRLTIWPEIEAEEDAQAERLR